MPDFFMLCKHILAYTDVHYSALKITLFSNVYCLTVPYTVTVLYIVIQY